MLVRLFIGSLKIMDELVEIVFIIRDWIICSLFHKDSNKLDHRKKCQTIWYKGM